MTRFLAAAALAAACTCAVAAAAIEAGTQQPQAMSLLDKPLTPPSLSGRDRAAAEAELARARSAYEGDPSSADALLALARATAHLGRLGEAIEIYTRGLEAHVDDTRFLLERGRYYLIIRKFDAAVKDFRKAADQQPEARCDEGVALYLKADFPSARDALKGCANEPWPFLATIRAGGAADAPAASDDAMLSAYIAAVRQLAAGRTDQARDALKPIVEKNRSRWMEPIYIAAEADYARVRRHASRTR